MKILLQISPCLLLLLLSLCCLSHSSHLWLGRGHQGNGGCCLCVTELLLWILNILFFLPTFVWIVIITVVCVSLGTASQKCLMIEYLCVYNFNYYLYKLDLYKCLFKFRLLWSFNIWPSGSGCPRASWLKLPVLTYTPLTSNPNPHIVVLTFYEWIQRQAWWSF